MRSRIDPHAVLSGVRGRARRNRLPAVTTAQKATWWPFAGQNLFNTHSQPRRGPDLGRPTSPLLVEKWRLTTAGNVTATPTVYQGVLYVPDMGGKLWAVTAGQREGSLVAIDLQLHRHRQRRLAHEPGDSWAAR